MPHLHLLWFRPSLMSRVHPLKQIKAKNLKTFLNNMLFFNICRVEGSRWVVAVTKGLIQVKTATQAEVCLCEEETTQQSQF